VELEEMVVARQWLSKRVPVAVNVHILYIISCERKVDDYFFQNFVFDDVIDPVSNFCYPGDLGFLSGLTPLAVRFQLLGP
jgi:hypothetical protein